MINAAKPCVGNRELKAVNEVFKTGWLGMGNKVFQFQGELKKMFGGRHSICVNSGTNALHLALDSLGIKKGDEVIVPSFTFVGTVQPIIACGAKPVFCDIELDDLNISVTHMKKLITRKTKVIMPVHYGGSPCRMDEILHIARKNNIRVVEDAAHAFGSRYKKKLIGSFGDITCFSFDPIKTLTCGEGGAVILDDNEIVDIMSKKRLLGIDKDTWHRYKNKRSWFYDVQMKGYRYHMSNINAAIGLAQLSRLKEFISKRQRIAKFYDKNLSGINEIQLLKHDYNSMAPFNYTFLSDRRERLMEFLDYEGIDTLINYIPNHMQQLFKGYRQTLVNTDFAFKRIISIPMHAVLTMQETRKVVNAIKEFYGKKK